MRILITNTQMQGRSGTIIFVRDLALELIRQGHETALFTLVCGEITDELRKAGVQVVTCLKKIKMQPDIIHGHHTHVTSAALRHFKDIPAIYICHNHNLALEAALLHPLIHTYFGVSRICLDRVKACGIPDNKAHLLFNSVDLQRFQPRTTPLPPYPRKALLFSNYAKNSTHLPAVKEACRIAGVKLDVVGLGVGRPTDIPECILGRYDIVFAKAKAAIEAMAVGVAVVLCDFSGAGPMVSSQNFAALQQLNFGFQALQNPLDPVLIAQEITHYDPEDAAIVRDLTRSRHGLNDMVKNLVAFYHRAITSNSLVQQTDQKISYIGRTKEKIILNHLRFHFSSTGKKTRHFFRRIPGMKYAKKTYQRLVRIG